MVVKRFQIIEGLARYAKRHLAVQAKRIKVDFMYETVTGWKQGHAGEWLVLVPGDIWMAVPDCEFHDRYRPAEQAQA